MSVNSLGYLSGLTTDFTNVRAMGDFAVDGVLTVQNFSANSLIGHLSANTVNAESGNTINLLAALSTNTLVPQSGNTLRVANGAGVILRSFESGGRHFDVRAFGAVGDGTTDDIAAFNAAIAASSAGAGPSVGHTVYVPPGDYALGSRLVLGVNNVTLKGTGLGACRLKFTSTTTDGILIKNQRVTVETLWIQGPGSGSGRGVVVDNGSGGTITLWQVTLRDLFVESFGSHGVHARGPEQLLMERVEAKSHGGIGVLVDDHGAQSGIDNTLRHVRAWESGGPHQIHINGPLSSSVLENVQALWKSGTTDAVLCRLQGVQGCTVVGGDFEGGTNSVGIRCSGDATVIQGATFHDVDDGIDWNGARGEIRGCRFTSSVGGNSIIVGSTATMVISSLLDSSVGKVSPNASATLAQMGRSTSGDWYLQKVAPRYALITITGATPSVANGRVFRTNNGASNTTITNFTGGLPGQRITILAGDSSSTIIHGTSVFMKAGANMSLSTGSTVEFMCFTSNRWDEV